MFIYNSYLFSIQAIVDLNNLQKSIIILESQQINYNSNKNDIIDERNDLLTEINIYKQENERMKLQIKFYEENNSQVMDLKDIYDDKIKHLEMDLLNTQERLYIYIYIYTITINKFIVN